MSDRYACDDGTTARLVGNALLIRPDPEPTETRGGIIVPGLGNASLHHTGEVLAVGYVTGKKTLERLPIPGIAAGDRVLYLRMLAKTAGNPEIKRIFDDSVLFLRPADVLLTFAAEDVSRLR